MGKTVDLVGLRFGKLLVLSKVPNTTRNSKWACRCDCGNDTVATLPNLKAGNTKSCGCFRREFPKIQKTTHGHKPESGASPEYEAWRGMIRRCRNPKSPRYADYGGRGIKVCKRWLKFEYFLADMGPKPKNKTLDRFPNNDGNYEPGNCAWRTVKQQNRNSRKNRYVVFPGSERCSVAEAAERLGITANTLTYWLNKHAGEIARVLASLKARSSNPKARRRVTGKESYSNL